MYKNILIWVVLGFLLTSLFGQFDLGTVKNNVTYSEFIQSVKQGDVSKVTISGNNITGVGAGGIEFSTYSPGDLGLMGDLLDNGVVVEAKPPEKEGFFKQLIISLAPILLLIGVILYTMKGASGQMGGKNPLSFGKSKARLITKDESISHSRMSPVLTRPRKRLGNWFNFCLTLVNLLKLVARYQKVF